MQDIRYHSVSPLNKKEAYNEFDNIDFLLSVSGRKLVGNSVRILGDVTVYPNGTDPVIETVSFDGLTGSHSWFNSIITSCSSVGQIENMTFYPHMVASKARAQLSREDVFQSQYVCETRAPDARVACALLKGTTFGTNNAYNADTETPLDFSIKPVFCLNNFLAGTDNNLPFAKTGDITISLIVSQSISVLFGTATTGNGAIGIDRNLTLSNLRVNFATVADDGVYAKAYQMRVYSSIKQSIQSTYANISTKAPLMADAFWMKFVPQQWDNNAEHNALASYRPPNVSRVEYLWSDSFNTEYTYAIVNEEEMLTNYVKAVNSVVSDNQCALNILASNDGYGLGMPFGSFIDLRQNKLSINLTSDISSGFPITCYMFFSGIVSL